MYAQFGQGYSTAILAGTAENTLTSCSRADARMYVCMHAWCNVSAIELQSRSNHAATTQQHAAITQQLRSNLAATRLGNTTEIT